MLCHALLGSSGQSQGDKVRFIQPVALRGVGVGSKKQSTTGPYRGTYIDVPAGASHAQPAHTARSLALSACGPPKVWGAGPTRRVEGGVCVVGWLAGRAGEPKLLSLRTQAPGQGPRLFMRHRHVFSCAFPHVPVHWPRPCAAMVTLPDSSKVHPPNVLLPNPVHFRMQPEIGEGAQEHAHTHTGAKWVSRRPARGIRCEISQPPAPP